METIKEIFSFIAEAIDIVGVAILIYGFVKIIFHYILTEFIKTPFNPPISGLQKIRCDMGIYILLTLDFLIASDIIHTIMEISDRQLIELAAIVILRTGIGYFLGKEIDELHLKDTEVSK